MNLTKRLKYVSAVVLFSVLALYLIYTGITGYFVDNAANIPIIKNIINPKNNPQTITIHEQPDSRTQQAVDRFMQEFNIPLAKRDEFIKKAEDIVRQLEQPDYSIVPPAEKNPENREEERTSEEINECFERVVKECG